MVSDCQLQFREINFNYAFQSDQTYETQSRISFVASRFMNGEEITCESSNPVLEAYNEQPERTTVQIQVQCEYTAESIKRKPLAMGYVPLSLYMSG